MARQRARVRVRCRRGFRHRTARSADAGHAGDRLRTRRRAGNDPRPAYRRPHRRLLQRNRRPRRSPRPCASSKPMRIASRRTRAARMQRSFSDDSIPRRVRRISSRHGSRNSRIAESTVVKTQPAQGQRAALRVAGAPVRPAARDARRMARVSLVSRHMDSAGAVPARADRRGGVVLRAVSAAAPLYAAARRRRCSKRPAGW